MDLKLDPRGRELLVRERDAVGALQELLVRLDADPRHLADLRTALADLEGIFMLVVVGEYNAGKSSLLNALLGDRVMPEGVTPTTDRITIVTHGDAATEIEADADLVRRHHPAPLLADVALVDTPGTNAIIERHQRLTEDFLPRADLVLFVTSAERPFTQSERAFLELIASWGRKITVVVNKIDILESEADRDQVLAFVRDHARETLHTEPPVFGVSARSAVRARRDGHDAVGSGLPRLEAHVAERLRYGSRLRLKLASPLGVALRVAETYRSVIDERLSLLHDDRRTLDEVDRQTEQFRRDMDREAAAYLARIKTVLLEVERRGEVFFDETVRLRNAVMLLSGERVREAFEARVIRGADAEIDAAVSELVDWFLTRTLQLWEDVVGYVNQRRTAGEDRVIGEVGGRFDYDRQALIASLRDEAHEVMERYDEDAEARRLADQLRQSVLQTGLLPVAGLGLSAAVVAFISSTALDITGISLGITLAGLSLLVLPRRRARAKRELHAKMQELRDGLEDAIGAQLERELDRANAKLIGAIAPYTRFVRSELERLGGLDEELAEVQGRLRSLHRNVERLETDADDPPGAASGDGAAGQDAGRDGADRSSTAAGDDDRAEAGSHAAKAVDAEDDEAIGAEVGRSRDD